MLKNIISVVKKLLIFKKSTSIFDKLDLMKENQLFRKLVLLNTAFLNCNNGNNNTRCIIFSKDRAIQLHALISSYMEKVKNPAPISIIYKSTNELHEKAYREVFDSFQDFPITPIGQTQNTSFKKLLIDLLDSCTEKRVFFLVDDILFIEDVDLNDLSWFDSSYFIPTLRMGENLSFAYTTQQEQKCPEFVKEVLKDDTKLCWVWGEGELDWSYPLSVDGHLFSKAEISLLIRNIEFDTPNTLESNLQLYRDLYAHRYGVCYKKSKILNIPLNRVQDDFNNLHGAIHQDFLLEQWNNGFQIDYHKIYGFFNISAHQEVPIGFIKRYKNYKKL